MTDIIVEGATIPPYVDPEQGGEDQETNRVPVLRYQRLRQRQQQRQATKSNLARNKPIPIAYGKVRTGGEVIVAGTYQLTTAFTQIGLALCQGEIEEIEEIYLNNMTKAQWEDAGHVWPGAFNPMNQAAESVDVEGIECFLGTQAQGVPFTFTRGGLTPDAFSFGNYTDTNNGTAQICLSYDSRDFTQDGGLTAIPTLSAVYKGKKIYDPRTDSVRWSPTFALFCLDVLMNNSIKPVNMDSAGDSAEFDEFNFSTGMQATQLELDNIDPNVRKIGGGVISDASQTWREWASMFADYAGCFLIERPTEWIIKPIRQETPVYFFNRSNIKGSVKVTSTSSTNDPNQVRVKYTQIVDDQSWTEEIAETPAPASDARIEELPLDWYLRQGQAKRAAIERLKKIQGTGKRIQFVAFDESLELERGDVINIDDQHKLKGVDAQITRIISNEIGRYEITALEHDQNIPSSELSAEPSYVSPGGAADLPNDFDVFSDSPGFLSFGFYKALESGDVGPAMVLKATQFGTPYDLGDYRIQYQMLAFDGSLTEPGEQIYLSKIVSENVHETEVLQTGDPFGATIAVFLRGRLHQDGTAPGPWTSPQLVSIGTSIDLRSRGSITNTQMGDVSRLSWPPAIPNSSTVSYEVRYYPGGVVDGFPGTGVLLGVVTSEFVETSLVPSGAAQVVAWQATHVSSGTVVGISSASVDTRFMATNATRGQALIYDITANQFLPATVRQVVGKQSNQTISSLTHVNVTNISFPVDANSGYEFEIMLAVNDVLGSDVYIDFTVPAGGSSYSYAQTNSVTRVTNNELQIGSVVEGLHNIRGSVSVAGTAGAVQLTARIVTSFFANPSVLRDSSISWSKIR